MTTVPAASLGRHETTIDGIRYTCTSWPAMHALKMSTRLCGLFGEVGYALLRKAWGGKPLGDTAVPGSEPKEDKRLMGDQPGQVGALLMKAASDNEGADGLGLIQDCFKDVGCDSIRLGDTTVAGSVGTHFDEHFKGRLPHLFEVLGWVVRSSFFRPGDASL